MDSNRRSRIARVVGDRYARLFRALESRRNFVRIIEYSSRVFLARETFYFSRPIPPNRTILMKVVSASRDDGFTFDGELVPTNEASER